MSSPVQKAISEALARRSKFPRWLNRAIDSSVDNMPDFLWNRLSPHARQAHPDEIPAAFSAPSIATERIAIGPVNYSGQGYAWARQLERERPGTWAHAYAVNVPKGFAFDIDNEVPEHVYASSKQWQDAQLAALSSCTHALVEAERPLLGRRFASFEQEAEELRARGLSLAFLAHGTDIRVPSEHLALTPWSVFADPDFYSGREEAVAVRNREALRRLGEPVFVSTPDLLVHLPEAAWCPVVVDPERWSLSPIRECGGKLVVAHVPSNAKLKGTDLIEPMLHRLAAEGVIEYRPVRGVNASDMPAVYGSADVVLDQFRVGSYGVAACEAMATGRVVVGHLTDVVREAVREATGVACPIVEATPDTLEAVLRELAEEPERRVRIGEAGKAFVEQVHDGRMSAAVLGRHWLDRVEPVAVENTELEPCVDVVIATHSPERPIARAVKSALYGSRATVRVTVVIHNTPVGPIREALTVHLHHPRLRLVEFADGIPSPAGPMNHGLSLATARYSSILGSDDELAQGAVDAWLELAEKHSAGAVIARIDFSDGVVVPQPPVRPTSGVVRDPVSDRLAYRSAPLGLVSTAKFGDLRLQEGVRTGEDIAYSARIWFSGEPILYDHRLRGYVGHRDASDRVTNTHRPLVTDLAFLPILVGDPWLERLTVRERKALAVKLLRVQLVGAASARVTEGVSEEDQEAFVMMRQHLHTMSPGAEALLSRAEHRLLESVCDPEASADARRSAGIALQRRFTLGAVLPRNLLNVLRAQAPLRYGLASLLLSRTAAR